MKTPGTSILNMCERNIKLGTQPIPRSECANRVLALLRRIVLFRSH
jgi:hypothetical protein